MRMSKRQYRIGDLAKELKIKKFVLRFWEKELNIKPSRSAGGQRFYEEEDFETFKLIKSLLYERKFTLAGAKKELATLKSRKKEAIIPSQKTDMLLQTEAILNQPVLVEENQENRHILHELLQLKEKLQKLQELL